MRAGETKEKSDTTQLLRIATTVREEFEQRRVPKEELKERYIAYNKIEDIDSFLERAEAMFPKLNCGLASVYLRSKIPKGRIIRGRCGAQDHTFIVVGEETVVDITADQYGGPKIFVGELRAPWSRTPQSPQSGSRRIVKKP